MIATDEVALMCDLAETYHIYDYRSLPPELVAAFSIGLRDNSRIKLKLNNQEYPLETLLLAIIADRLGILIWSKTKDAEKGRNKPQSIAEQLMPKADNKDSKDYMVFDSPEEFEKAMEEINRRREVE